MVVSHSFRVENYHTPLPKILHPILVDTLWPKVLHDNKLCNNVGDTLLQSLLLEKNK